MTNARTSRGAHAMRRRGAATMLWAALLCTLAAASDEVARSLTQLQSRGRQQTQAARRLQDLSYEDPRGAYFRRKGSPTSRRVLANGASSKPKVAAAGAYAGRRRRPRYFFEDWKSRAC